MSGALPTEHGDMLPPRIKTRRSPRRRLHGLVLLLVLVECVACPWVHGHLAHGGGHLHHCGGEAHGHSHVHGPHDHHAHHAHGEAGAAGHVHGVADGDAGCLEGCGELRVS